MDPWQSVCPTLTEARMPTNKKRPAVGKSPDSTRGNDQIRNPKQAAQRPTGAGIARRCFSVNKGNREQGNHFLRWRILDRMRRFFRPILRRPLPDFLVPKSYSVANNKTGHSTTGDHPADRKNRLSLVQLTTLAYYNKKGGSPTRDINLHLSPLPTMAE